MKRRDFLRRSAMVTSGLIIGAPAAFAGQDMAKLKTYNQVDQALFKGINRAPNPSTTLEKLHVPIITIPDKIRVGKPFQVSVSVGEILHPMKPDHYIHWVNLFAGNAPAGRGEFWPELNEPEITLNLKLDKPVTLIVREYCNLHGLWEHRKELIPT